MKRITENNMTALVCAVLVTACTNAAYEEGDGALSYTRAEMVDVTVKSGKAVSAVTDDGTSLNIAANQTVTSTAKDTLMRWMLYYNKVNEQTPVEFVSYSNVYLLKASKKSGNDGNAQQQTQEQLAQTQEQLALLQEQMNKYPLKLTSIWKSANGKYVNMQVGVMSDKLAAVLVEDSVSTQGKGHAFYTMRHALGDAQLYYTQKAYISILWPAQDTLSVTMTTEDGINMHTFAR